MYVKVENGLLVKYPYSLDDLRQENPNTSFPSVMPDSLLESFGVFHVVVVGQPDHDKATQGVRELPPEIVNGSWRQKWEAYALPPEEVSEKAAKKASEVRAERNAKLSACDWTQVADAPVDKQAWAAYRQSLRDVSTQTGFPWDITWPTEP